MRERITFVHDDPGFDPEALDIQDAGLLGPLIDTARQDRLTFAFDELPHALADLVTGFDALHIRWASPLQYESLDPFGSRISPGLHVSYSPSQSHEDSPYVALISCLPRSIYTQWPSLFADAHDRTKLCNWLQRFGPIACMTPKSFTESDGDKASASSTFYFYHAIEDLQPFVASSSHDFCPELDSICQVRLRSLYTAAALDLTFDAVSNIIQITTLWPLRAQTVAVPASNERRTEVGIFFKNIPPTIKAHELGVAGVVTVLGDQKKPSPTIFTFPSRHRQIHGDFTSKFLTPTGLHPTLQLSLSSSQSPNSDAQCSPFAYLTLPKSIFADRYQLADELLLASKNLTAARYTSLPVDLEAPAYTTESWGSRVLVELAPPSLEQDEPWTAEIPLHLRYLEPSSTGEVEIEVPYPAVFWACASGVDDLSNPFDRVHLGYDELFERQTIFWHVTPQPAIGKRLVSPITVPVLNEQGADWIGVGTAAVVSLGFAWVLWKLVEAMIQPGNQQPTKPSKDSGKKE
ncbi:Protein PBN1 [Neonectria ditissima]|uniref:Protein PBN1 n=1 Tax=Neonectria ditissima TaxID=78410 RepID=A0A0P7B400_9HYPO|nr:Protein PBN1 [Neonectria ditissima]